MLLVEEFQQHGVEVVFLKGSVEDSPEGKLLLHMQGAIAEYERTKIPSARGGESCIGPGRGR